MKKSIVISILAFIVVVGVVGAITMNVDELKNILTSEQQGDPPSPLYVGSIIQSQEYTATTTESGSGNVVDKSFKNGHGALGSIVITKAGDAEYMLLDASSTLMSWDDFPTSTRTLADVPASLVAGTYIFDANFNYGLYLDVSGGSTGTTTLTYR